MAYLVRSTVQPHMAMGGQGCFGRTAGAGPESEQYFLANKESALCGRSRCALHCTRPKVVAEINIADSPPMLPTSKTQLKALTAPLLDLNTLQDGGGFA